MFRPSITKIPIQAYTQTIDMQNDKYKQYPNWQNTLNHNFSQTQLQLKGIE